MSRIETGTCFCEGIAAEMSGEPFFIAVDHDDDCRKAVGGPMNVWVGYRSEQVRLERGNPKAFSKTGGVTRTFCPDCGTSISYIDEGLHDEVYLAIGFLDNPERFRPQEHSFWRMKLPWIKLSDDLPRKEGPSRRRDDRLGNPSDR